MVDRDAHLQHSLGLCPVLGVWMDGWMVTLPDHECVSLDLSLTIRQRLNDEMLILHGVSVYVKNKLSVWEQSNPRLFSRTGPVPPGRKALTRGNPSGGG